jgi:hypothetical protein
MRSDPHEGPDRIGGSRPPAEYHEALLTNLRIYGEIFASGRSILRRLR